MPGLLALTAEYAEQGLWNGTVSVCLSVCLSVRPSVCRAGLRPELGRAKLIARSTIDMLWRKFPGQEFGAKFRSEVPLILELPEFPYHKV